MMHVTDPEALRAHLVQLAREYHELVQLTDSGALDGEEHRALLAERSVTHDQIIALFEELGIPFVDRDDVRRQALEIASRGNVLLDGAATKVNSRRGQGASQSHLHESSAAQDQFHGINQCVEVTQTSR